jgi:glutamate N-acetyltransferase/amino-acid N-acetyltransferase
VRGGATIGEARCAARTVAGSPLVKSAVHGNDPNWGRVIAAVARSGVPVDEERTSLTWQGVRVFEAGAPVPFDKQALSALTQAAEVRIEVDLGVGNTVATAWGCDLSAEYVKINAEYTT